MNIPIHPRGRRIGLAALALVGAAGLLTYAVPPALGQEPIEVEQRRYSFRPRFVPGDAFRLRMSFRQASVTALSQGRFRRYVPFDWADYDGLFEMDTLVRIEKTNPKGEALAFSARLDALRLDVPDPLQNHAYRLRVRERKQKHLPTFAHPLEGQTIVYDATHGSPRIKRVMANGRLVGITPRYPEMIPLMQEIVKPDWIPADSVGVGTAWRKPNRNLAGFSNVLSRSTMRGQTKGRLIGVVGDVAQVEVDHVSTESRAKVDMTVHLHGIIEVDTARRLTARSEMRGTLTVSSPTSSMRGTGTVTGVVEMTEVPPFGPDVPKIPLTGEWSG